MLDRCSSCSRRADQSLERPTAGLGVGLTLARALVAVHGGTVVARSEGRGKGSELRRAAAARRAPGGRGREAPSSPPASASTGIACWSSTTTATSRRASRCCLSELGNEVRVANDGAQGLDMAKAFVPQVAFLDIGMPKLNGYRLAEAMRAEPRSSARTSSR
jgi:hypothetical protein